MVDIHSHILPGVDDGASTLEESLEMLRIAVTSGTTDIVATPHCNAEFAYDSAKITDSITNLRGLSEGKINIHLACDFHLNYANITRALSDPYRYTINRNRYLLLELPDLISPTAAGHGIVQLQKAGFLPIITHPERNLSIQNNIGELADWVDKGALLQVTAQSFEGRFGPAAKRAADQLLKLRLVHFVASDAHDCFDRTPNLTIAYHHVCDVLNERDAHTIFVTNPTLAVNGETLPRPRARRTFSSFFK